MHLSRATAISNQTASRSDAFGDIGGFLIGRGPHRTGFDVPDLLIIETLRTFGQGVIEMMQQSAYPTVARPVYSNRSN